VASARTRTVGALVAAALIAGAPTGFAATKKKKPKPRGPVPGTVVWHMSGAFQHGIPRLTQAVWTASNCGSTTLGPEDTNNFSASVVNVGKWAGKQLSVVYKPNNTDPVNAPPFNLTFFDASCNRLDVNDGKHAAGEWDAQKGHLAQAGMLPLTVKWVMMQASPDSTQFEVSPLDVSWNLTVRIPRLSDGRATPMTITGGTPV
jgi:hypothetical protein